jgi:hypothetical protein
MANGALSQECAPSAKADAFTSRNEMNDLLRHTGADPDARVRDVAETEVNSLRGPITTNCVVEGDLRCEVSQIIRRLMDINRYAVAYWLEDSAPGRTAGQSLAGNRDAALERSKGEGNEIRNQKESAANHNECVAC